MNKTFFFYWIKIIGLTGCLFILAMMADVQLHYRDRIENWAVSPNPVKDDSWTIIVLGASVKDSNTPSDALRDRLDEGLRLYQEFSHRILITGDNGLHRSDEISLMKRYLLEHGVDEKDLLVDGWGFRTYESCARARSEFQIKKAILVTQRFHLTRALYLCNELGVESIGSVADKGPYKKIFYFWSRDLLASVKAWSDINIVTPESPIQLENYR